MGNKKEKNILIILYIQIRRLRNVRLHKVPTPLNHNFDSIIFQVQKK